MIERERVYVGDWKSLCDERDFMWAIGRACIMIETLFGRLEELV